MTPLTVDVAAEQKRSLSALNLNIKKTRELDSLSESGRSDPRQLNSELLHELDRVPGGAAAM